MRQSSVFMRPMALVVMALVLVGCGKKEQEQPHPGSAMGGIQGGGQGHVLTQGTGSAVAGVRWTVPTRWIEQAARQMRVATYAVPRASGDPEDGECAVFFFGSGQGGDVESNIDRWVAQFENAGTPSRSSHETAGMRVDRVEVRGTYLAPAGPMMQSTGKKENFKLLGAIVAAPEGSVFFKFTGPARTVEAAGSEFDALINSITK